MLGAIENGVKGKDLEERVSTFLVKGWRKGMTVDGTIKHVYVFFYNKYICFLLESLL